MLKKRWLSPGRFLVLGFASVILAGTILLLLPISARTGVVIRPIDALFTATSAVCVTGLAVFDPGDNLSIFGRVVLALLIQIGGLGIASIGTTLILLVGRNIGLRDRILLKESLNLDSLKGVVKLLKAILLTTLTFELIGMALSFCVFVRNYPPVAALGISAFHAVSAFNNAGFDILGGMKNMLDYQNDVLLNLTTCGLIIMGGLGFYTIREIVIKKRFRTFSTNTKIVLMMTALLLASGTILIKLTSDITWLAAFFQSTSARTAGFSSVPIGGLSTAGLFILIILMFIGASPGSTGGGIKTTTTFTLFRSVLSFVRYRPTTAFRRKIPTESVMKAFILTILALSLVTLNTLLICIIQPEFTFIQVLFEVVSSFGTVGLSTGITPSLSSMSKIILSLTMFFGRLGPLTIACIWTFQGTPSVSYAEDRITIG